MKTRSRTAVTGDANLYCDRCRLRVGIAEPHVVKRGKAYHYACYAKMKNESSENENGRNPELAATSLPRVL
jgi:hypothetical protein